MSRLRISVPGRALWSLAAALIAVVGLQACSPPHIGLSSGSVSACYRAIPVATRAVHSPGAHMIGVHRVPVGRVRPHLQPAQRGEVTDADTTVCAVVFEGMFTPGQVAMAGTSTGRYAIVLVVSRTLHLLTAVVLHRLPPGLGRRLV